MQALFRRARMAVAALVVLTTTAVAWGPANAAPREPRDDPYTPAERRDGAGSPPPFEVTTPPAASDGEVAPLAAGSDAPTLSGPPWFNFQHDGSLVPQPPGLSTNTCWRRSIPNTKWKHWHCRLLYYGDYVISYTDPNIRDVSEPSSAHLVQTGAKERTGREVGFPDYTYEGCWNGPYTLLCGYVADNHWDRRYEANTVQWYLNAFNYTQADTSCAWQLGKFFKGDYNWTDLSSKCGAVLW